MAMAHLRQSFRMETLDRNSAAEQWCPDWTTTQFSLAAVLLNITAFAYDSSDSCSTDVT